MPSNADQPYDADLGTQIVRLCLMMQMLFSEILWAVQPNFAFNTITLSPCVWLICVTDLDRLMDALPAESLRVS